MTCPTCSRVLRVSTRTLGDGNVGSLTDASEMFTNVTLSLENYNAPFVGWVAQDVHGGVGFNGGNSQYSIGEPETARSNLVDTKTWSLLMADSHRVPGCAVGLGSGRAQRISCRSTGRRSVHSGGPVLSYTATALVGGVPVDPAKTCTTPDGSTLTCTVSGLTNGTEYTFVVVATNDRA